MARRGADHRAGQDAQADLAAPRGGMDAPEIQARFTPRGQRDTHARFWAGPLWAGPLHDTGLVEGMQRAATSKILAAKATAALVDVLRAECEAPAFWVEPDLLQKRLGGPPRRDVLIERLRAQGHVATRTHLEPQGVRTEAPMAALASAWKG